MKWESATSLTMKHLGNNRVLFKRPLTLIQLSCPMAAYVRHVIKARTVNCSLQFPVRPERGGMGGGLLACPSLNPRLLSLGPQNTLDRPRWYFIISVHSLYSDSIITPYMSFNSAFFFKLHVWPSLGDRISLPCILTYSILNPLSVIIFHFGFFL